MSVDLRAAARRPRVDDLPLDDLEALVADVVDPIMSSGSDAEVAADHGVSPAVVRQVRREYRQNAGLPWIMARARELADAIEWDGTLGELIEGCIADCLARHRFSLAESVHE